jgi:hypothetical protein
MKNNNILEALGLNIPNNQYNNPYSLNIDMEEDMPSEEGDNNNDNPYNENPILNEGIPEYEEPGGEPSYSINDLLKQKSSKGSSLPQKEYSFEGGMEKALSRINDIRSQLKTNTNDINPRLSEEQSGIALRRGMGAAHQADAAKPWRSSGTRGFINDLSGMIMQGLGGYDTSRQQMLKENEEKAKYKLALEMQQDAIARAIEKDLYSRDYDKEKLGLEREKIKSSNNSELARLRAESMLRNSETNQKRLELNQQKWDNEHPNFSKNNPSDFEVKDHGSYLEIEGVNVSRASSAGVTKINDNKNKVADGYKLMLDARKKIDDFYIKHNITEENDPRLNTLNRFKTVQAVKNFAGNLPGNPFGVNQEMWDDWKALIESTGQIAAEAERKIKGGILTTDILKLFAEKGYITDFEKDYKGTFDKKFDVMTQKIGDVYKALEAASLYRANIDSINLMKILENKEKKPQKTKSKEEEAKKEVKKDAEENKNNKLTNEIDLSEFEAKE